MIALVLELALTLVALASVFYAHREHRARLRAEEDAAHERWLSAYYLDRAETVKNSRTRSTESVKREGGCVFSSIDQLVGKP